MYRALALAMPLVAACAGGTRPAGDPFDLRAPPDLESPRGDLAGPSPARVVINEVDPNGADPASAPDWIELENVGGTVADISGWLLRDSAAIDLVPLPAGTRIPAGGFLVLLCDDQPVGTSPRGIHLPFKLNGSKGDEVHLRNAADEKVDVTSWKAGDVADGRTWARHPDGTGGFEESAPSRGAPND